MTEDPTRKASADWSLHPEAFGRFLSTLNHNAGAAAQEYERLRRKLIRLFEWRGCRFPEDLADETINRVIRKMDQDRELPENVSGYSNAVAGFVFQEYLRRQKRESPSSHDLAKPPFVPGKHTTTDLRLSVLEDCLDRLSARDRELIVRYYDEDQNQRIQQRRALAEELGIAANTLRIRAYRIRARLLELMIAAGVPGTGEVQ